MPVATSENIYKMVYDLMREGADIDGPDGVRERLLREVDAACDSIQYGENDENESGAS